MSGVTDDKGMIWQSYRYSISGEITFGKPQYNNVYSYNAENYNPNIDSQYLRARYYSVGTANFLTEDGYLGQISVPLSLNRYNYVKSSPLNFIDPSGFESYVFYTSTKKSDFSKQAQWRAEQLEKKGETVILKETNSANDFIDAWNSMGEVDGKEVLIEDVIIYSHGRPYTLIFADGSSTEAISIDGKNSTGKSIPNIHDLMEKAVTRLYINACNAGHLTYYEDMGGNVASVFSEKIGENGVIYAYDGNVSFGPHAWEVGAETSYETRLSSPWAQKTYWESTKEHSLTNPQPKGETMYHNGKIQNYYPSTSITAVRK